MKIHFDRILCATDLSDLSKISVSSGIHLAKEFSAKLYVCHIVDLTTTAAYGDVVFAPLELQEKTIAYAQEQINRRMENETIDWQPLIRAGHPSDEISKIIQEHEIDLAVSATRGHRGLKRVVLGSVTERLMRTLPCPLLIVRSPDNGEADQERLFLGFNKILVGCDFSSYSDLAFQYGLSLAQDFESELHLVHVIEKPVYKDLLKSGPRLDDQADSKLHMQINEDLSRMIPEESYTWCHPKIVLLAGHPYKEIIKYSLLNQIDLIVLGIRGLNLIETLFTGSTTDRVSRQSPCPVLSICPTAQNT